MSPCPNLAHNSAGHPYITLTQAQRGDGGAGRGAGHSSEQGKVYDEKDTSEQQTDKHADNTKCAQCRVDKPAGRKSPSATKD